MTPIFRHCLWEAPVEVEALAWENASKRDGGGCGIGWWGHPAWLPGLPPNVWKTWYLFVRPIIKINRKLKMYILGLSWSWNKTCWRWNSSCDKSNSINWGWWMLHVRVCSCRFPHLGVQSVIISDHFGILIFDKFCRSTCLGHRGRQPSPLDTPCLKQRRQWVRYTDLTAQLWGQHGII